MSMLHVENLRKEYPTFTLQNVTFTLPQGSIMGFIGRNGAGKTTTLKAILGMVHADGGSVHFLGRDTQAEEQFFKENIGVAISGLNFYPKKKLRVLTDVLSRFYPNWDWAKYRHYVQLFALEESKTVEQLSQGMRIKYLLALALSHNARLLLLDEPTSGLDPVSRDELVTLFRAIVRDGSRSILFSTHITADLEKCADTITYIQAGAICYSGSLDDFRTAHAHLGNTLEEMVVALERKPLHEDAIV